MKYSKTTLMELSRKYKGILKKCAFLNAVILTAAMIATPAMAGLSDVSSGNIAQGSGEAIDTGSTIDFNGNTYTFYTPSVGSAGTETLGLQLNAKSGSNTFKNGTLNVAKDRPQAGNFKTLIQNYADLTLDNMIVDGTNLWGSGYVVSHNNGKLNINNSTITAFDNGIALDVYYWSKGYGTDDTIATVKDTTINGHVYVGMGETDAYAPDFSGTQAILNLAGTTTINGTIQNNGIVNISDNLILNGTITKGGDYGSVEFKKGSTLKTNLNGSTIVAGSSVTGSTALILEGDANGKTFKIDAETNTLTFADNTLYDITAVSEATESVKTWTVTKKATETITENLTSAGADATAAEVAVAVTEAKPVDTAAQNVANAITTAAQTGDTATLNALTKAVNPTETPAVQQQAVSTANQIFNVAGNRMAAEGMSGGGLGDFAYGPWIQGLYNRTNNTQGVGYDGYSQGFALGVDVDVSDDVMVGIGYGYTASDIKSSGRKTNAYANNFFAYAKYQPSQWYATGIINYGHARYKEQSILTSHYDVDSWSANAMMGYQSGMFDNYAGIRYTFVNPDDYSNGLTEVKGKNSQVGTAVIGTRIAKEFKEKDFAWKPEVRLAATYDFKSDNSSSVVNMVGGTTSYIVSGERLKRFGVEAGVGVTATIADNLDLSLNYDAGFRKDHTSQTGSVKVQYHF